MERTLVSKFVDEYNKVTSETTKQAMVKKHVVKHYSPITNKINMLRMMNEKAVVAGKHGKYIDMSVSKLNFIASVLALYTDLTPDKDEEDKPVITDAYDRLKETGALDLIINEIGVDIEELLSVQEQVLGTWHNENASTAAYISGLVEKISMIFSTAMGKEIGSLADVLSTGANEDKAELVAALMENFKLNREN